MVIHGNSMKYDYVKGPIIENHEAVTMNSLWAVPSTQQLTIECKFTLQEQMSPRHHAFPPKNTETICTCWSGLNRIRGFHRFIIFS